MVLKAVGLQDCIPDDGCDPQAGQMVQDDSGAEMHMLDSKAWCVLGYTEAVRMYVGTAKVDDSVKPIDAVAPLVAVMDGNPLTAVQRSLRSSTWAQWRLISRVNMVVCSHEKV